MELCKLCQIVYDEASCPLCLLHDEFADMERSKDALQGEVTKLEEQVEDLRIEIKEAKDKE